MGFLAAGHPFSWEDSKEKLQYIREHGILQFIAVYKRVENVQNDDLFWGDEVEYAVLETSGHDGARTVKLALVGVTVMETLKNLEKDKHNPSINGCAWHQEYGSWMVEGTPQLPYSGYARDLLEVEQNMRLRRSRLLAALGPRQLAPTTTNFPLLGARSAAGAAAASVTVPDTVPGGAASESTLVSDACINPHPRFGALTSHIRQRRGSKVQIRMPLFRDTNTPEFAVADNDERADAGAAVAAATGTGSTETGTALAGAKAGVGGPLPAVPGSATLGPGATAEPLPFHLAHWPASWPMVNGDCMAFGMGCCCLQVTFQSRDVLESRFMYDQLANLSPIMLALTAATPLLAGKLLDSDTRWSIISQAVDDRTPAERGLEAPAQEADPRLAGGGVRRLAKSRYDSVSCYLSPDTPEALNDVACEVDAAALATLRGAGMDAALSRHVAHLFTRDPLVLFNGSVEELPDDGSVTDHWESLQSTNWQTMRWKPPPAANSPCAQHIGWRTEFRSMEVQLSDFENAALTVFIVLLTRVLLVFDLDLRMPLSKVDENMARAHVREPVKSQVWWFRKNVLPTHTQHNEPPPPPGGDSGAGSSPAGAAAGAVPPPPPPRGEATPGEAAGCEEELFEEMTMGEIMGGKGDYFPGLVPLCYAYLEHTRCDKATFKRMDMYLTFILQRASGAVGTDADWIRAFVTSHGDYRQDSVVPPTVAHDLAVACDAVGRGALQPEALLGSAAGALDPVRAEDAYGSPLASAKLSRDCRASLVRRIVGQRKTRRERLAAEQAGRKALTEEEKSLVYASSR